MKHLLLAIAIFISASFVMAQNSEPTINSSILSELYNLESQVDSVGDSLAIDTLHRVSVSDSLLQVYNYSQLDLFAQPLSLPDVFFMPAVYDKYDFFTPLQVGDTVYSGEPAMRWIEDYEILSRQMKALRHDLFYNHSDLVRYNLSMLPEAPKQFQAEINPADFTITTVEYSVEPTTPTVTAEKINRRHWIRAFNASLQFSQAYVSPNWYQGGNNNLNALAHIFYNVKLNQEYHPNLLFETTAQYKLGINNATDDEFHSYNVSEDLFQINTTLGLKAANRWYYSFTGQFKTQLVNSYKSNSMELKSAFMSPGELTAGVGMTYNYANTPKTLTFDTSIAPLSYNLVVCYNDKIDPGVYGIDAGKHAKSKFGSTIEMKVTWQITYNINLRSRLFTFSDYDSFQADWENTLSCDINKFFTTQIYVYARYDSNTPHEADSSWSKLQLKEIFSIGFAYKFSSI